MRTHRYGAAVAVLAAALVAAACGSGDSDSPDAERGTTATVATESAAETAPQHDPSPDDDDAAAPPAAAPDADAPPQTTAPEPGPAGPDGDASGPGDPGDPSGFTAAEQAYLAQRGPIPAPSDQAALDDGYAVCAEIAAGSDYLTVRQKAGHAGSEVEIGGVVNAAAENLCPDQRDRLTEIIRERD